MIQIIGLICMISGESANCQPYLANVRFDTMEQCQEFGESRLNTQTPFGIVKAYKCVPVGEDV